MAHYGQRLSTLKRENYENNRPLQTHPIQQKRPLVPESQSQARRS